MKTAFFLLFALLFSSCGKDKLTPAVNPVTVNELRNDQPLTFSYELDRTQIDEYARGTKKFPIFGKLFQAIAFVVANTKISSKGGHELDIDDVEVDLNSLGTIDFDYIDWIHFDSLLAHIGNPSNKDSLEFLERVEIYGLLDAPLPGIKADELGYTRLVFFDKKIHKVDCNGKCLNLRVENIDWKELIKNNPRLKLRSKVIINSVPKKTMTLVGAVSFSIKFNVGF